MRLILFALGVLFALWNYQGFVESPGAVWHAVAFMLTAAFVGSCAFGWFFDWATAPNYQSRYLNADEFDDDF